MFKGTYRHRIDAKGRLPVPAPFRRALSGGRSSSAPDATSTSALVVTPLDQCLAAYPAAEWARLEARLRTLPAFARAAKALTRLLASRAVDCGLDVQGRILLPAQLREQSGLAREVLVVGVIDRFEIWAPERWEAFVRESEHLLNDAGLDVGWPLETLTSSASEGALDAGHPQAKPKS